MSSDGPPPHLPAAPERADLPLPDYDHLPLGGLASRIRTLTAEDVRLVLAYEQAHGHRLPAVQILEQRLTELEAGAQPSGGSPDAVAPEAGGATPGGSAISPATAGPAQNPPSHGVPTNPAQPRSTG